LSEVKPVAKQLNTQQQRYVRLRVRELLHEKDERVRKQFTRKRRVPARTVTELNYHAHKKAMERWRKRGQQMEGLILFAPKDDVLRMLAEFEAEILK
jgi:hypothetical protein